MRETALCAAVIFLGRKDRLGKLIHDLDVIDAKDRKLSQGKKITVYRIHPEKVQQVSVNYRVK
jgi:hypothetical protein